MTYRIGQIVRYSHPERGEESLTFTLIEDNGDRVLIESRDFPAGTIAPREVVAVDDIACGECGEQHNDNHECEPITWAE